MSRYKSEIHENVEYETTPKGLYIRNLYDTDEIYISNQNIDVMMRRFNQETIDEILNLVTTVRVHKCQVCEKEYYTRRKQQRNCSEECRMQAKRETTRAAYHIAATKKKMEQTRTGNLDKEIERANKEGLSYGQFKAREFIKTVRVEI